MALIVQNGPEPMKLQFTHEHPRTNTVDAGDGVMVDIRFHGSTEATLVDSDGAAVATAVARVHYKDQFVKEEGRRQALKKLQAQLRALGYSGTFLGEVWKAYANRNEKAA